METVTVQGRFIDNQEQGLEGCVWFIPKVLWYMDGDTVMATMGGHRGLRDGHFSIDLTATHQRRLNFHYDVWLGTMHWQLWVDPSLDGSPIQFSDLISQKKAVFVHRRVQ